MCKNFVLLIYHVSIGGYNNKKKFQNCGSPLKLICAAVACLASLPPTGAYKKKSRIFKSGDCGGQNLLGLKLMLAFNLSYSFLPFVPVLRPVGRRNLVS